MAEMGFEPVQLPCFEREAVACGVRQELDRWLRSEPIRELATLSGWQWPDTASVRDLARELAELSSDWDFRGRTRAQSGAHFVERSATPSDTDVVLEGGRTVDVDRVLSAANALGLVETRVDETMLPTHVVILSGTARANVNRATFAANIIDRYSFSPRSIVGLGAHRELGEKERASTRELGLADTDTEWTTLRDALTQALHLGQSEKQVESHPDSGEPSTRFSRSARYEWKRSNGDVQLHVAPSPAAHDEKLRPANTEHQLRWWIDHCDDVDSQSRILVVTTQIYVPYQHMVALRVIGVNGPGCHVMTTGVDAIGSKVSTRNFTARDYLQEVRSALLAARSLADEFD
jgi:hypothetical protein